MNAEKFKFWLNRSLWFCRHIPLETGHDPDTLPSLDTLPPEEVLRARYDYWRTHPDPNPGRIIERRGWCLAALVLQGQAEFIPALLEMLPLVESRTRRLMFFTELVPEVLPLPVRDAYDLLGHEPEALAWYEAQRDRLVWDSVRHCFVFREIAEGTATAEQYCQFWRNLAQRYTLCYFPQTEHSLENVLWGSYTGLKQLPQEQHFSPGWNSAMRWTGIGLMTYGHRDVIADVLACLPPPGEAPEEDRVHYVSVAVRQLLPLPEKLQDDVYLRTHPDEALVWFAAQGQRLRWAADAHCFVFINE